ncbi:MAG TPA: hypothetical protein VIS27_02975 [Yeosuana sp.]
MKTIITIAFLLIGMMSYAQRRVDVNDIKINDVVIIGEGSYKMEDMDGEGYWAMGEDLYLVVNVYRRGKEIAYVEFIDREANHYAVNFNDFRLNETRDKLVVVRNPWHE